MPRSDSSLENCCASTKSRLTGSCKSSRQSSLIAPAMWPPSYALVSSSTSTKTTFAASRLLSAQSAETRTSERAMGDPFDFLLRGVQTGLRQTGGRPEARHKRVELAAKADAEGRIQEGGHQSGRGGDNTQQWRDTGESGNAADSEDQADQLSELQWWHRFTFGDRSQPRRHDGGEHPSVGMTARPTQGADGKDNGLQAQNDGGGHRADRRDDQRGDQDHGRDPGGEPGPADVDAVWLGAGVAA